MTEAGQPSSAPLPSARLSSWLAGGRWHHGPGGHRLFCRREGKGEALLLLHGFPTASFDWHALWQPLAGRHDVIAADFLGFGFSDKPRGHRYSIFDQTDRIEALLRDEGIESLHILAHDMGDSIAQEMLARAQERADYPRIRSVCLLNGGIFYDLIRPLWTQRLLRAPIGRILQRLMNRRGFGRSFSRIFGPETRPDEAALDEFWYLIVRNGGKGVLHAIIQYLGERERFQDRWTGALARAPVPLRLIYGPEDPVSGTLMAERLALIAPKADIIRIDGIGHYPQIEAPEAVLSAYLAFRGRIIAGR